MYNIQVQKCGGITHPDLKAEKMDFEAVVLRELDEWFDTEFAELFHDKYGPDAEISVVFFDTSLPYAGGNPLIGWQRGLAAEADRISGPGGLMDNVVHKGRFVLRTGLPSSEAARHPELVEAGDFPWEGAGTYRNKTGGASGLKEECDWWVFRRVVDQYWEIRADVGTRGIFASKQRLPGMKYMEGDLPPQEWL